MTRLATTPRAGRALLAAACCGLLAALGAGCTEAPGPAPDPAHSTDPATESGRRLTVASYGGAYQAAQREAMFEPFAEEHGVEVVDVTHGADLATIAAMVESGSVEWDLIDVESSLMLQAARAGLLEPLDLDRLPLDQIEDESVLEHAVAVVHWSTVLAYGTDAFAEGRRTPASWTDFWDLGAFPGARALRDTPVTTLEIALLADGVPAAELYPLDVDRAFASLDRIAPQVTLWWNAGSQPPQALADGSVALASCYSGRIAAAQAAGKPVGFTWSGGLVDHDWWVIPRGAENRELAMELIAFASQAGPQAAITELIPYGPVNRGAFDLIPEERQAELPTYPPNFAEQRMLDAKWWLDHEEAVTARWERWRRATPED